MSAKIFPLQHPQVRSATELAVPGRGEMRNRNCVWLQKGKVRKSQRYGNCMQEARAAECSCGASLGWPSLGRPDTLLKLSWLLRAKQMCCSSFCPMVVVTRDHATRGELTDQRCHSERIHDFPG